MSLHMARLLALTVALTTACGTGEDGPFDDLILDGQFDFGLGARVDVARDSFGIAHIKGKSLADVAFVQGYVMAHDRLPQMDLLRRFGAGTMAELFGAVDPSVIDTDLEMRMHRMVPLARETLAQMEGSASPIDAEIVEMLQRFADGVNTYAADLAIGKWQLDPRVLVAFDPDRFAPWSPVDSLVLGRFQAFSLSFTVPAELELTELYQKLRAGYPAGPRAGIASDLLTFKPLGTSPTIADFPDGLTTSNGYGPMEPGLIEQARGSAPAPALGPLVDPAPADPARPRVPDDVLAAARTAFATTIRTGPHGAPGPHAFMRPHAGSNNWAVGPGLTLDGSAILATDQHLQLPNPSIFYPTHLIIDDGDGVVDQGHELDVIGVTFPGIPGVILGSNGFLAWSGTVSEHDVNDIYLETLVPCPGAPGSGECVRFNGEARPIGKRQEEIRVGAFGTITETFVATYEDVPQHGPVIPEIDRTTHRLKARPAGRAPMTVKYTGYKATHELRALVELSRSKNVLQGFQALAPFSYGSQNWMMIDSETRLGWTTHAEVPVRSPATYQWHAKDRPDAAAPFFVLSGEGAFEWEGMMSAQHIPHARDVAGAPRLTSLATANADPVGATFDNDPLNGRIEDGRPLYAGVAYAAGVRQQQIVETIATAAKHPNGTPKPVTLAEMEALQHDSTSTVGEKLVPQLLAALAYAEDPAGAPADVAPYVLGLPAEDRARLATARAQLGKWDFATPVRQNANGSSGSTAIFNAWMHFFIGGALGDELAAVQLDVHRLDSHLVARVVSELLSPATILSRSSATGQPILCDDVTAAPDDGSCTRVALAAMVAAMRHLESPAGFKTADVAMWDWGALHHLTIEPLFPDPALTLPRQGEQPYGGFSRRGDNFNVNRADMGWRDLDFAQSADGAAQRFVAIAPGGGERIRVRWQLPGGVIYDSRSRHYRDLLDNYYLREVHFDAPYELVDIVRTGEVRWEFR